MKKVCTSRLCTFLSFYRTVNPAAEEMNEVEDPDDDFESTAARFTARLLKFLLKGFLAKDKSVRYRVLQTVAEMVSHLGEIEYVDLHTLEPCLIQSSEEIYEELRTALLDRVNDKETFVRVQAVIALCKLCGAEDRSTLSEGQPVALDVLLEILAHDSSP